MRLLKLAAVFFLFTSIILPGATQAGPLSLSPIFGGFYWDDDSHLGNGPEYGLGAAYNFNENFGTELMFNFADPGTDGKLNTGDVNLYLLHLDAVYHVRKGWVIDPYLAVGGGIGWLERWKGKGHPRVYDTLSSFNCGGGLEYFISRNTAIRGDLRYVLTLNDHNYSNFMYTAGISYYVGK